jgi:hypothetical protein
MLITCFAGGLFIDIIFAAWKFYEHCYPRNRRSEKRID